MPFSGANSASGEAILAPEYVKSGAFMVSRKKGGADGLSGVNDRELLELWNSGVGFAGHVYTVRY